MMIRPILSAFPSIILVIWYWEMQKEWVGSPFVIFLKTFGDILNLVFDKQLLPIVNSNRTQYKLDLSWLKLFVRAEKMLNSVSFFLPIPCMIISFWRSILPSKPNYVIAMLLQRRFGSGWDYVYLECMECAGPEILAVSIRPFQTSQIMFNRPKNWTKDALETFIPLYLECMECAGRRCPLPRAYWWTSLLRPWAGSV